MTYLEDEMSAHDGQPIELYEFYSNSTTGFSLFWRSLTELVQGW
jgi:hypothetical protein